MRKWFASLVLTSAVLSAIPSVAIAQVHSAHDEPAAAQPAAKQADVPVKAVVLYSSGVGYFEHFGTVQGDGSTQLNFKTQQINDILKSLVLQDLDGGKVSAITYPSQDPIAKTLASFQVNISTNPPLADLLNQLRGARVTVGYLSETRNGVILGVEKRPMLQLPGSPPVDTWMVNLLDGPTIRQIELNKINDVKLEDAKLQEEITRALSALSQARDQDKKPVSIAFQGQGDRRVRIGYVVETPVWKTSYRLLLPGGGADEKSNLQGWAIVENQTDNDWTDVQLSLVSGRPISFIQDLYQPLYIPRPVVVPELYASLRPQMYEGGRAEAKGTARFEQAQKAMRAAPAAAPVPGGVAADSDRYVDAMARPMDPSASVSSVASASKVGELFQYTVGNVTLPRQKSAMLPIITDPIEVEKLSIYNAAVLPKNPLNGARVKNTTDKHLLAGPITVLEGSTYAGDAQIDNLPPGQERLLSYGIDLQVRVDSTSHRNTNAVQTGKIVKGVLQLKRKLVSEQDYTIDNKSDHVKSVIVEHPIKTGWKLIDTDKPIETTDTLYRFKGSVEAGKASKLTVKEEIVTGEQIALLNCDPGAMAIFVQTGEIPESVREQITKAIQLKQAIMTSEQSINERNGQIARITEEQNRIRENMKTVDRAGQYYRRLEGKLNEQESQIEKLQGERDELMKQREALQKELEDFLNSLNVG
jgi:hypothetical protein